MQSYEIIGRYAFPLIYITLIDVKAVLNIHPLSVVMVIFVNYLQMISYGFDNKGNEGIFF
jgi:hypothetical protein